SKVIATPFLADMQLQPLSMQCGKLLGESNPRPVAPAIVQFIGQIQLASAPGHRHNRSDPNSSCDTAKVPGVRFVQMDVVAGPSNSQNRTRLRMSVYPARSPSAA